MAVPESGAELPPFRATAPTPRCRRRSEVTGEEAPDARYLSITKMATYQDKSLIRGAPLGALLQGQHLGGR